MLNPLLFLLAAAVPWTQFRGPNGQGDAGNTNLPLTWSEQENVVWKTPIPGKGWSSPVVCDNQVWMTTATDEGRSLRAVAVALDTGKLLHDIEVFHRAEPVVVHARNSHASPTPVIEPGRVYVNFGTAGTACLDTATGRILWRCDELKLIHMVGPGSSPILYRDLFIINCDGTNTQYIAALDKNTGKIAWKTKRSGKLNDNPDFQKAFSTCAIATVDGKDQLISVGADWVYGYDPLTGADLWRFGFKGYSNVAVPALGHGLAVFSTAFGHTQLWAVKPGGHGDITSSRLAWKYEKSSPIIPSPLFLGNELYFVIESGVAGCLDRESGAELWREVLGGSHIASPIHANGRIYFFGEKGKTTVTATGRTFKRLATNELAGVVMATPAVAGNAFIVRTETALYRIETR